MDAVGRDWTRWTEPEVLDNGTAIRFGPLPPGKWQVGS